MVLDCYQGVFTKRATLYVTHPPCFVCAKEIVNSGIYRVVWIKQGGEFKKRWHQSNLKGRNLLDEHGVKWEEYCDQFT